MGFGAEIKKAQQEQKKEQEKKPYKPRYLKPISQQPKEPEPAPPEQKKSPLDRFSVKTRPRSNPNKGESREDDDVYGLKAAVSKSVLEPPSNADFKKKRNKSHIEEGPAEEERPAMTKLRANRSRK